MFKSMTEHLAGSTFVLTKFITVTVTLVPGLKLQPRLMPKLIIIVAAAINIKRLYFIIENGITNFLDLITWLVG